ncbi:hypothetical protein [Streptomyces cacaoi]|uniref:hypothetical protein n=1 Tax=Streptomyces cacaoi TaxID=1898 RepID=UPI00374A8B97
MPGRRHSSRTPGRPARRTSDFFRANDFFQAGDSFRPGDAFPGDAFPGDAFPGDAFRTWGFVVAVFADA